MLIVFGAFEFFFEQGESNYCNDFNIKSEDACVGTCTYNGSMWGDTGCLGQPREWYDDAWHRKRCGSGYYTVFPQDPDQCSISPFISIPQAMWWCLVTLL